MNSQIMLPLALQPSTLHGTGVSTARAVEVVNNLKVTMDPLQVTSSIWEYANLWTKTDKGVGVPSTLR